MHSTTTIETRSCSKSFPRKGTTLYKAVKARADRELEWYFANAKETNVSTETGAAIATIGGRLETLPSFHRGAIALRHDARVWPKALTDAAREYTAMAVRIHCSDHPTIGSTEVLEKAAAQRLDEVARVRGFLGLADLCDRADERYQEAVEAYMKARGTGACVAPWTRVRRGRRPPATAA
jgi:hypothetical protein